MHPFLKSVGRVGVTLSWIHGEKGREFVRPDEVPWERPFPPICLQIHCIKQECPAQTLSEDEGALVGSQRLCLRGYYSSFFKDGRLDTSWSNAGAFDLGPWELQLPLLAAACQSRYKQDIQSPRSPTLCFHNEDEQLLCALRDLPPALLAHGAAGTPQGCVEGAAVFGVVGVGARFLRETGGTRWGRYPGAPTSSCGIFPQASRNLDIAQNFFFPALSSFYLCASAIEGARGPRSVVSTTVGVSVWNPGHRWSEVRGPTSAPTPHPLHFAPERLQKNQVFQREWRTVSTLRFHGDKSF